MAGHASGWRKIAAGPLKDRRVFISKAIAEAAGGRSVVLARLGEGHEPTIAQVT